MDYNNTNIPRWINMCLRKAAFRSHAKAEKRAAELAQETELPFRSYHCPDCNKYHLTSKPLRKI